MAELSSTPAGLKTMGRVAGAVGGGLLGAGKAAALGTGAVAAMGLRQAASAIPGGAAAVTMGIGGATAGLGMIGRGAMKGFRGSGTGSGTGTGTGNGAGGGAGGVGIDWKQFAENQINMYNCLREIKSDTSGIRKMIRAMKDLAFEEALKRLKKIEKPPIPGAPLLLTDQRKKEEDGTGFPFLGALVGLAALGAIMKAIQKNLSWVAAVLIAKPWKLLTTIFGKAGLFSKLAIALGELKFPTLSGIKNWLGGTARYVGGFFSRIGTALANLRFPTFQGIKTAVTTFFSAEGPIATALSKIRIPKFTGIRNWLFGTTGQFGVGGKAGFFGRIAARLRLITIPGIQGIKDAFKGLKTFFSAEGPLVVALKNLKVPSFAGIKNWLGQGMLGRFVGFFGRIGGALGALTIPKFAALSSKIAAFFGETGPIANRFANIVAKLPKIGAITPYLDDIARFFSAEGPIARVGIYLTNLIANAAKAIPGLLPKLAPVASTAAKLANAAMGFLPKVATGARTMAQTMGQSSAAARLARNARTVVQTGSRVTRGAFQAVAPVAKAAVMGGARLTGAVVGASLRTTAAVGRGVLIGGVRFSAVALKYTGMIKLLKWLVRRAPIIGTGGTLLHAAMIMNNEKLSEMDKANQVGDVLGTFFGTLAGIKVGAAIGGKFFGTAGAAAGTVAIPAPGVGTGIGALLGTAVGIGIGGLGGYLAGQQLGPIVARSAMGLEPIPGQNAMMEGMRDKLDAFKGGLTSTRKKIESQISAVVTKGDQGEEGVWLGRMIGGGWQRIRAIKSANMVGPANDIVPSTARSRQGGLSSEAALLISGLEGGTPTINVGTVTNDQSQKFVQSGGDFGGVGGPVVTEKESNWRFSDTHAMGGMVN